ncbi:coproporphyrinogen dehydrogenase HemZ [Clostridiaceae bacterium 35-E11]
MISVLLNGHDFQYEVGELLKLFVEAKEIQFIEEKALVDDQSFLLVNNLTHQTDQISITTRLIKDDKIVSEKNFDMQLEHQDPLEERKFIKRMIKLSIYEVLSKVYDIIPPWGILTGIRPTKIVHDLMDKGLKMDQIKQKLKDDYRISEEKIHLVTSVALVERPFIESNHEETVSLYIGIPFCPTKCVYCSFPSNPLNKDKNQIKDYLIALNYEIQEIGKILKNIGKKVETLYIGGGTPTSLDEEALEMLMKAIKNNIDLDAIKEITVEAGRPDTITKKKLSILKENAVNRISINPQTMNPRTLKLIGRSHTPQDIIDTYQLAKQIGFDTINMDTIIGLPGEMAEDIQRTMEIIGELNPENITVHTLAIKKTSQLRGNIQNYRLAKEDEAKKMLDITQKMMKAFKLMPYYMYRQKYMVGNLENIGYAKPGHECLYNIQIMEERQSIIALGAGATSKIFYSAENRLERVPNVTNVDQYIARVAEMIDRKKKELYKCI